MGVIGSSAMVLFDSGGCTLDCDVAGESCKLPSISAQITIPRRRRAVRAFLGSPGLGHCNKNLLNDIFAELWSERKYSAPDIDPPSNPILRHNSVHAETLADEQATRCMEEADSGDRMVDDISNHGSTSRPARSVIGEECRYLVMSRHRVSSRQRRPF